jgi:hypothetical protein
MRHNVVLEEVLPSAELLEMEPLTLVAELESHGYRFDYQAVADCGPLWEVAEAEFAEFESQSEL